MNPATIAAQEMAASLRAREAGDPVLGAECAERARGLALQAGQRRLTAEAGALLAHHLYRQGLSERAAQVALEALPVVDTMSDAAQAIDLRNTLTMSYVELDMPGDALPHAVEALRRARLLDALAPLAWCLNRLSVVYDNLGDTARAVELQRQAIEAADADGSVEVRFSSYVNLASTLGIEATRCNDDGQRDEALALAQQVLGVVAQAERLAAGHATRSMYVCGIEFTAREVLGDATAMHRLIERHQALAEQQRLPHFLFVGEMLRARAHLAGNQAERACALIESRLDGHQAVFGDNATLRSLLDVRYRAYKATGRFERALVALEEARTIEKREARQRVEAQSRLLLREVEIASARHEADRLRRESAALAERAAAATQAALRDALTGLHNRRALDEHLQVWLRPQGNGQRKRFAAALIDIDHFKRVNDTHGHETGDKVLQELARLLDVGTRGGDIAFRQGGEEFALLIDVGTLLPAAEVCERLRRRVEQHDWRAVLAEGGVTISIGMTTVTDTDDTASLLRRADKALYRAKHEGRNRLVVD
jgi:diguanylate cyclase (GGDEF)-like protein